MGNGSYTSIPCKRTTAVKYNFIKRRLERQLGRQISHDDFMTIILFPSYRIVVRKTKRTAEIVTSPAMSL